jgi:hypothetical protein
MDWIFDDESRKRAVWGVFLATVLTPILLLAEPVREVASAEAVAVAVVAGQSVASVPNCSARASDSRTRTPSVRLRSCSDRSQW